MSRMLLLSFLLICFGVNASAQNKFDWAVSLTTVGGGFDQAAALATDSNGNVYSTGMFTNLGKFAGSASNTVTSNGKEDVFVIKQDSSGNLIWAKSVGGTTHDYGWDIAIDPAGNVLVCGQFEGVVDFDPGPGVYNLTSNGSEDAFVLKLDAAGNFIWARQLGNKHLEVANSIIVDTTGTIFCTGAFSDQCDFDPGPATYTLSSKSPGATDIFIWKLSPSGQFIWAKSMGGNLFESGSFVTLDLNSNIYLTGRFSDSVDFDPGPGVYSIKAKGKESGFICKLDSTGAFKWAASVGDSFYNEIKAVHADAQGNIYACGYFNGTTIINTISGPKTLSSAGFEDLYIAKYDPNGNCIWANRIGSGNADLATAIKLDVTGELLLTGSFSDTVDFDPGSGTHNSYCRLWSSVFILKLDTAGQFKWVLDLPITSASGSITGWTNTGSDIIIDRNNNIIVGGLFVLTTDFDPGSGTYPLTSSANHCNPFILRLQNANHSGLATPGQLKNPETFIYPNPARKELFIFSSNEFSGASIRIINMNGSVVSLPIKKTNERISLDLSNVQPGNYILELRSQDGSCEYRRFTKL